MNMCTMRVEEGCPLAEACNNGVDAALFAREAIEQSPCNTHDQGRVCGPVTTYFESVLQSARLRELDANYPVTHRATINVAPEGAAPLEVRESVVGVSLRIRENLQSMVGEPNLIAVHPLDLYLALEEAGKLREMLWYQTEASRQEQETGLFLNTWHFGADELEVSQRPLKSTLGQYNDIPWRREVLGSFWSGYLLPSELFSTGRAGDEFFERLQAVANDEYGGDISQALLLRVVTATFMHRNMKRLMEMGPGRTISHDTTTGGLTSIYDEGGICIYDRDRDIDFRGKEEMAVIPPPLIPLDFVGGESRTVSIRDWIEDDSGR